MIAERHSAAAPPSGLRHLGPSWLTRWRAITLAGAAAAGGGVALGWSWLTAVGAAPILLGLAPCVAMCALGLCMRGKGAKSCARSEADPGPLPRSRQE